MKTITKAVQYLTRLKNLPYSFSSLQTKNSRTVPNLENTMAGQQLIF